tara:strand:+ start:108796 stop:109905 length:1110 start_codon:yes stop_codon:yes gene_type:complete
LSDKDEIKELFQRELGNYEAKVDPGLWAGVQSGISTGAATTIGIATKVVIGVLSTAAVVVGSILIYNSVSEDDEKKLSSSNAENPIENIVEIKNDDSISIEENENKNSLEVVQNKKNEVLPSKNEEIGSVESDQEQKESSNYSIPENNTEQNNHSTNSDPEEKVNNKTHSNSGNQADNEESSSTTDEDKEESTETNTELPTLKLVPSIKEQNNQYVKFESSTENITEIVWDFGDGNLSTLMNPEHFYDKPGTYEVQVTGRNGEEEIYRDIEVVVEIEGEITKTPNSFTPNGDRDNDYLFIESKGLKEFQITILNNKQEVVYKSNDIHFRWDGNLANGTPAPEGNYIYIIVAKDNQDNTLNNYQQLHLSR